MNKELVLNRLPVPTWNRLRVNFTNAEVPEKPEQIKYDVELPSEIDVKEEGFAGASGQVIMPERSAGEEWAEYIEGTSLEEVSYVLGEGKTNAEALRLTFNGEGNGSRINLVAKDNANLTVVYNMTGDYDKTIVRDTLISAGDNATVTLIEIYKLGDKTRVVDSIGGIYGKGATFKLYQIVVGGKDMILGACADLNGNSSAIEIDSAYLTKGDERIDYNYIARHRGQHTTSNINVSGALDDKSSKTFRGTIDFLLGASGAKGSEREDVLLLSEDVINKTVPVILCVEEDVEGEHGASIGRISDEALLYFASRGIEEKEAEELLATARIDAVSGRIPDEKTKKELLSTGEDD